MTDKIDQLPAADALLRFPPLKRLRDLSVMGLNTRFETNTPAVLEIVEESFGGWASLDRAKCDVDVRLKVRIVVYDGAESENGRATVRHYCPDSIRLIVHSSGSVGVSDPQRHDATAYVTSALVADRPLFRESVLEALTFALLAHFDRHPIHASSVVKDDHAVLLAGPSGAGKSSLAHAAHAAGMSVLSEDRVWVQRTPFLRVWGNPGQVRLVPDSAPPGAAKVSVALALAPGDSPPYVADRATVCLLDRTRGAKAALVRVDEATIVDALTQYVDSGFDRFPRRHMAVIEALARDGGWRLSLTSDPRDALPSLQRMLDAR